MGVIVGVFVLVAVALGLGETVQVGVGVLEGVTVLVAVSVGAAVCVIVGRAGKAVMQLTSSKEAMVWQMISLNRVLRCNGIQRCNVKKGIVIPDFTL